MKLIGLGRYAGAISFEVRGANVHFGVWPSHWLWGRVTLYDNIEGFGIGPLILVAWDAG